MNLEGVYPLVKSILIHLPNPACSAGRVDFSTWSVNHICSLSVFIYILPRHPLALFLPQYVSRSSHLYIVLNTFAPSFARCRRFVSLWVMIFFIFSLMLVSSVFYFVFCFSLIQQHLVLLIQQNQSRQKKKTVFEWFNCYLQRSSVSRSVPTAQPLLFQSHFRQRRMNRAPLLWNMLPREVQTSSSMLVFKKKVLSLLDSPVSGKNLLQICLGNTIVYNYFSYFLSFLFLPFRVGPL